MHPASQPEPAGHLALKAKTLAFSSSFSLLLLLATASGRKLFFRFFFQEDILKKLDGRRSVAGGPRNIAAAPANARSETGNGINGAAVRSSAREEAAITVCAWSRQRCQCWRSQKDIGVSRAQGCRGALGVWLCVGFCFFAWSVQAGYR